MVSEERYYIERNGDTYLINDYITDTVYVEPCDIVDLLNEKEAEILRLQRLLEKE